MDALVFGVEIGDPVPLGLQAIKAGISSLRLVCRSIKFQASAHDGVPGKFLQYPQTPRAPHSSALFGSFAYPHEFVTKSLRMVRGNNKPCDAVFHDFRHARDVSANGRRLAAHTFQKRLPEQFRNLGFRTINGLVNARQNNTNRAAVSLYQGLIVAIAPKRNLLSLR